MPHTRRASCERYQCICFALDFFLAHFISMGSAVFVHRCKLSRTKLLIGPDVVSHETQTQAPPGNWGVDVGAVHVGTCVWIVRQFLNLIFKSIL